MSVDVSRLEYKFEFPSPVNKSNMNRQHEAVDVCDTPHNLNLVSSGGNNPSDLTVVVVVGGFCGRGAKTPSGYRGRCPQF
jgi:hypothetical protein